jgi:hypothetical protein
MTAAPVHLLSATPLVFDSSTNAMFDSVVAAPSFDSSIAVRFRHRRAYRVAWALVVAAHVGIVVAYDHEAYINSYILLGSKTEMAVQLLGLGATIQREIGVTLVVTNRVLMAWHLFAVAQIVLSSFWNRQLVFRFARSKTIETPPPPPRFCTMRRTQAALQRLVRFYRSTGARGRHFHTAFEVREAVEIVSQTVQAYHISCLITNVSVLHFVSLILVLNCWSTPVIQHYFRAQETKQRLVCLAVDAVFDFCCALAIPFLTFSLWEYQVATLDFFDAVWLIRSSTLLQYNLVNTWAGVITTRLPALGLILALETIKTLLHCNETKSGLSRLSALSRNSVREGSLLMVGPKPGQAIAAAPVKHASRSRTFVQGMFFLYGLVILILYTKAMAEPTIDRVVTSNCLLQLRPWGRKNAQCAVLDIDCMRLAITGRADEISFVMDSYDTGVIASVTIANCPALVMPPTIKNLGRMLHLEVYNSTIAAWDSTAALTRDAHPVLTGIFFVKARNLGNGLPAGLLSPQFPPSLCVMAIAGGDLGALAAGPEETQLIETAWPATMFVTAIEQTSLREFPAVLLSKTITQTLSLSGSSISAVPSEAFVSSATATALWLTGNPIASLPPTPPIVPGSRKVSRVTAYLDDTQLSEIPVWFATLYGTSSPPLVSAHGTPLCTSSAILIPAGSNMIDCGMRASKTYFPLAAYEAKRLARSSG